MRRFKRGTLVAAIVLSLIAAIGIPFGMAEDHGLAMALLVVVLCLIAVWGSRLGVNSLYRAVFEHGRDDERGKDTDFI
jgi:hypothetical protein